jgi:hypothetical protein
MRPFSILMLGALFAVPAGWASAAEPPRFSAFRTAVAPVIDGNLDDPAWATAVEISGFTQREPDEGAPATQQTFVRILYDDDALYIGARLEDGGPVTSRLGRRDTSIESDSFRIFLDPHLDRRSGAHFGVYASNVQYDAVLYNDTNADPQWDAVWASATKITASGWNVEMRIPLSQLRFPDRPVHTWGINMQRYVSRLNEVSRLVHVPRTESGFVSRFALLEGIEGIRPRRSLEVLPYAAARAEMSDLVGPGNPFRDPTEQRADAGLDLKYRLTSNLTLTGTINPDFGQVEVDPASVNLTQFELFFPERRPFFTEGSNLFSFGFGTSDHIFAFGIGLADFFYSRRIGREPQATAVLAPFEIVDTPRETTILAAAKLTGRTANGWSIGVLNALTDREKGSFVGPDGAIGSTTVEPATNHLVARLSRDIGTRGRVGILTTAVNRDLEPEIEFLRSDAYTGGVDGYWSFRDRAVVLDWYLAGSHVRGSETAIARTQRAPAHYFHRPDANHLDYDPNRTSLSGYSARTMLASQQGTWQYNLEVRAHSPGFEVNDIGFLDRSDAIATHAALLYFNYDIWRGTRSRTGYVGKYQNWNFDGDLIHNGATASLTTRLMNYSSLNVNAGFDGEVMNDRLTRGGPVVASPARWRVGSSYGTDTRRPLWISASASTSRDTLGGSTNDASVSFNWRPAHNVSLRFSPAYRERLNPMQYVRTVTDPLATATYGARYVFADLDQRTVELTTRLDWTFTSRLSLQLYAQPYVSAGSYDRFKELVRPRATDYARYGVERGSLHYDPLSRRYTIDPDSSGDASSFSFTNPDFNFRSARGNAVIRWEFRPGSSLFVVWNENRAELAPLGELELDRDLPAALQAPKDNVFMIKMSYWLGL